MKYRITRARCVVVDQSKSCTKRKNTQSLRMHTIQNSTKPGATRQVKHIEWSSTQSFIDFQNGRKLLITYLL